jgi:hypothetical protein
MAVRATDYTLSNPALAPADAERQARLAQIAAQRPLPDDLVAISTNDIPPAGSLWSIAKSTVVTPGNSTATAPIAYLYAQTA